jgi:hypothetical protein
MNIEHPEHKHSKGQRLTERGRTAFYVLASSNGRPMLLGGYTTRGQADSVGLMRCGGVYEVVELSSNSEEATREAREKGILESGLHTDSFRRFKHT